MKLCLMRHGDAVGGFDDAARPLSAQGLLEAENAGRFLARIREVPDVICHSPLLRSRQTAEVVARVLGLR
ncbi:histidine phosphatase family protein, partial [Synergistaceae bacterium OttesenSCG-928-I11]|nr:histidine phosphatase family protein [Synergistaceae bacterium OttesenSCG-928-I11]